VICDTIWEMNYRWHGTKEGWQIVLSGEI
jgi:hypothetical protein